MRLSRNLNVDISERLLVSKKKQQQQAQLHRLDFFVGIDAQSSSIILGNVKCYGTEHRGGNFVDHFMIGTVVPIMQFANSDIEDLKIVEDETPVMEKASTYAAPVQPPVVTPPQRQPSIHDDPAIVRAVVSSTKKDLTTSNQLVNDLEQLNFSNQQSRNPPKTEGISMMWIFD